MFSSTDTYAQLEQRFADWSSAQPSIAAVIVVGSRARSDHPADEWSDLDLVVLASDTASYLQNAAWLNTFGVVIAAISNPFGQNDREWIAVYADGSKIDVAFLAIDLAATPTLAQPLALPSTQLSPPMVQHPRLISDTATSLRPNFRYFMSIR